MSQTIFLQFAPAGTESSSYHLAERVLIANRSLPSLTGFAMSRPDSPPWLPPLPQSTSHFPKLLYADRGWVGNANRLLICRMGNDGYQIEVEQVGAFTVDYNGQHLCQVANEPMADLALVEQTVVGPILLLALALQGVFGLHASAAMIGGRLVAFIGESGQGKSTLAAYLAAQPGWQLVADDLLPVQNGFALPHFPQLKYPPMQQPAAGLPQRLPLTAIYLLADGPMEIELLSRPEAARHLLRHTVVARLFDSSLLARQFQFCLDMAHQWPLYRLAYPRRMTVLPQVAQLLNHNLPQ